MWNGTDTLYGNEWIDYQKMYIRLYVAKDGIVRVPLDSLIKYGFPANTNTDALQLFYFGQEIPIYVDPNGYVEFQGRINRGELDRHLFLQPDTMMGHPEYSLITDTSAYFFTWTPGTSGKRFQLSTTPSVINQPIQPWYWAKQELSFAERVYKDNIGGFYISDFTWGEGWHKALPAAGVHEQMFTIPISTAKLNLNAPPAKLRVRFTVVPGGSHIQSLFFNGSIIQSDTFDQFKPLHWQNEIPLSLLQESNSILFKGYNPIEDRQAVAHIELKFPAQFQFNQESNLFLELPSGDEMHLILKGLQPGVEYIIYDIQGGHRITGNNDNGEVHVLLPAIPGVHQIYVIQNNTGANPPIDYTSIQFKSYLDIPSDMVIISNPELTKSNSGIDYVTAYRDYRTSVQGGNRQINLVWVTDLYDQFAYGVKRHVMAVRNFGMAAVKAQPQIQYFFLLGRSLSYQFMRTSTYSSYRYKFLLPSFGTPGSDQLLFSPLGTITPIRPVGRLAADNGDDIGIYLNKLIAFEAQATQLRLPKYYKWTKHMLQLGGGDNEGLQSLIKHYLLSYESTIEDTLYGASTTSFFKTSTDPIQVSQSEQIIRTIRDGLSLMNFFGHSSASGFDFKIDNPTNFKNLPRLPLVLSFGCYSGVLDHYVTSISEDYIFTKDGGAIGFMATTGLGIPNLLDQFGTTLFRKFSQASQTETFATLFRSTIQELEPLKYPGGFTEMLEQLTYHGDPLLKLPIYHSIDPVPDPETVKVKDGIINTSNKTFTLEWELYNLGIYRNINVEVRYAQRFPDGTLLELAHDIIPLPAYKQKIEREFPILPNLPIGENRIIIQIDPLNKLDEGSDPGAKWNNNLQWNDGLEGIPVVVVDNALIPVSPPPYAMIPQAPDTLWSSTTNNSAAPIKYLCQVDTSQLFNSPALIQFGQTAAAGTIGWPIPPLNPNMVWYWRVSPDSISPLLPYRWTDASFCIVPGHLPGWNQSHYYQFAENAMYNVSIREPGRKYQFLDDFKDLQIYNGTYNYNPVATTPSYAINGTLLAATHYKDIGYHVAVFDSIFVNPWENTKEGLYGSINNKDHIVYSFNFPASTFEERQRLIHFLQDTIPDGNYVLVSNIVFSNVKSPTQPWIDDVSLGGKNIFDLLNSWGASTIQPDLPKIEYRSWSFFTKKDRPEFTPYEFVADSGSYVSNIIKLQGTWYEGDVTSSIIGPASSWNTFESQRISDNLIDETNAYQLSGIKTNGSEVVLLNSLTTDTFDISTISAKEYPLLRFKYAAKDSMLKTMTYPEFWRIGYTSLPEGGLTGLNNLVDTVEEGDELKIQWSFNHLDGPPMDSLFVWTQITDSKNNSTQDSFITRPLLEHDAIHMQYPISTNDQGGLYQFQVKVNPEARQPEQQLFNNNWTKYYYVKSDVRPPFVDATFDGVHIVDQAIVSSNPVIRIRIQDENDHLLLNDTTLAIIELTDPNGIIHPIYFSMPGVEFTPASGGGKKNHAIIQWQPECTLDGLYTLTVRAFDRSGNEAADHIYSRQFQVINQQTITKAINYPNPFSTSTRWLYTLTGGQYVHKYQVTIYTITGNIVRQLTASDLGVLKPGAHLTEGDWNGTDQFGQSLANGVYLYRFTILDDENKVMEHRDSDLDPFFEKDFGKLVIIR